VGQGGGKKKVKGLLRGREEKEVSLGNFSGGGRKPKAALRAGSQKEKRLRKRIASQITKSWLKGGRREGKPYFDSFRLEGGCLRLEGKGGGGAVLQAELGRGGGSILF